VYAIGDGMGEGEGAGGAVPVIGILNLPTWPPLVYITSATPEVGAIIPQLGVVHGNCTPLRVHTPPEGFAKLPLASTPKATPPGIVALPGPTSVIGVGGGVSVATGGGGGGGGVSAATGGAATGGGDATLEGGIFT